MSTPKTLPEGLPEVKVCPRCYAEGRDPYMLDVLTHFYLKKAARYKGGYRISAYCREHENKERVANLAAQRKEMRAVERETGVAPPALEKIRSRSRSYQARPLTEEQRERRRAWRVANAERLRMHTDAWVAKNKDQIRARKHRWYMKNRKRLMLKQRMRRIESGLGVRKLPKEDAP